MTGTQYVPQLDIELENGTCMTVALDAQSCESREEADRGIFRVS